MTAARRQKDLYDLSRVELQNRIRGLKEQLDLYRLPSPERMSLIERLLEVQDRLIELMKRQ